MPLGFIGTGEITRAIVHGLCRREASNFDTPDIVVSPRGAGQAHALAQRFERVTIATSNQEVLDRCDTVILAVRPQVAEAVLSPLTFRHGQHIVSVIAMLPMARVADLVSPATHVTRAAPPPPVALGRGATAIFPDTDTAHSLFGRLGFVQATKSEDQLEILFTATATMATYFAMLETLTYWLQRRGLPPETAQRYTAELYGGLGDVARAECTRDPTELREDFSTPGGINEQLHAELRDAGVFENLDAALNAVIRRLQG